MSSYSRVVKNLNNTGTSFGQQLPRKGHEEIMVKNSAGGYVYTISDDNLIDRILILGTTSNTYYSSAEKLTTHAIHQIKRMIVEGKGQMVVDHVKSVYESGRAPKQDPTFFVLALLTQSDVPLEVRKNALKIVSNMRTFTQLYSWIALKKQLANGNKGFGRATRSAICELFKNKTGLQLVYQATKYGSRKIGTATWTIGDVISCAHVPSKVLSNSSQVAIAYMVNGIDAAQKTKNKYQSDIECENVLQYLNAVEAVKSPTCTSNVAVQLILQFNLPRETLSTHLLNFVDVWKALLGKVQIGTNGEVNYRITMPITALIRNLGVMSSKGVLEDELIQNSVENYIKNQKVLLNGRVHPVTLLQAKLVYQQGRGVKGSLAWTPIPKILNALEDAFYLAFGNIKGTGKRILHAIDCSGSMSCGSCAVPLLTSCQAVGTLVMEAIKREHKYHQECLEKNINSEYVQDVALFKHTLEAIKINENDRLDTVMKKIQDNNFGSTDCALPMVKALETYKKTNGKKGAYDAFIVYTDNETYYGEIHPSEALDNYRKLTGINAKLVVVATTPTNTSIGFFNRGNKIEKDDSEECLNIAGFDLNGPSIIRDFLQGNVEQELIQEIEQDSTEFDIVDEI